MARNFLGQGIKYPFAIDRFGRIELENDVALVRQSIIAILETPSDSQFVNPEFGSMLYSLRFEPNGPVLDDLLEFAVRDAIERWEPRVVYRNTILERSTDTPNLVNLSITYIIKSSDEIDGFIFPFYSELVY